MAKVTLSEAEQRQLRAVKAPLETMSRWKGFWERFGQRFGAHKLRNITLIAAVVAFFVGFGIYLNPPADGEVLLLSSVLDVDRATEKSMGKALSSVVADADANGAPLCTVEGLFADRGARHYVSAETQQADAARLAELLADGKVRGYFADAANIAWLKEQGLLDGNVTPLPLAETTLMRSGNSLQTVFGEYLFALPPMPAETGDAQTDKAALRRYRALLGIYEATAGSNATRYVLELQQVHSLIETADTKLEAYR